MNSKLIPVAFSITTEQNLWIESEAEKRASGTQLPINKSVVVREAIELMRKECNNVQETKSSSNV